MEMTEKVSKSCIFQEADDTLCWFINALINYTCFSMKFMLYIFILALIVHNV